MNFFISIKEGEGVKQILENEIEPENSLHFMKIKTFQLFAKKKLHIIF